MWVRWLFSSAYGLRARLVPRWLFLRALALIYFSAFYALLFQIRGLIGTTGILPASDYLKAVSRTYPGWHGVWFAPTVLWLSPGDHMLLALCWIGIAASVSAFLNLWPRFTLLICFVCFLSFVSAAGDFSGYQSDGMLLEAGFVSLFLAPPGLRPGLGAASPPSRASYFLLVWEWLRIYFESGLVKLFSGDIEWRNFTAMDEYYQNGPLPTWIGWYLQHLPHWFHAATVALTLGLELGLVWMILLPRRWRIVLFWIVTPWEIAVILTANYAFLNYLVLCLGVLLLDDRYLSRWNRKWSQALSPEEPKEEIGGDERATEEKTGHGLTLHARAFSLALTAVILGLAAYNTTYYLVSIAWPVNPLPSAPVAMLEPFRIANRYGLFAVMTRGRYEIEFQGSDDGRTWTPYPFRYKPQALNEAPGIYAPYQPRFDWNLWFASLGDWRQYPIVPNTETCLLSGDPGVLALFRSNPFANRPPKMVRAVLWQYWFTSLNEKSATGNWWTRKYLGRYAPTIQIAQDGRFEIVDLPDNLGPHE